jgi:transcriptional regulator GlxA family with amidase domain
MSPTKPVRNPPSAIPLPKLRVGFLLIPRFTLLAFAGFIDSLRLAADDGDRSRPLLCTWGILGDTLTPVVSSSGVSVRPTDPLEGPCEFDFIVVVGGLLHGGQQVTKEQTRFLKDAAARGVSLVGLCTGSFVLARAGLMDDHLACVSWFHREEFVLEFPQCRVVSNQMFVADRERLTCAGGTSVVHLAAFLIERAIGRANAVKALRIMLEEQPMASRTLQPEQVISESSHDTVVRKAMFLLEQNLQSQTLVADVSAQLGIGRRQLERRFRRDVQLSPAEYRNKLRIERAKWLLQHTDLEIFEVGLECGFQNGAHFARSIRTALGASPTQIRNLARRHLPS